MSGYKDDSSSRDARNRRQFTAQKYNGNSRVDSSRDNRNNICRPKQQKLATAGMPVTIGKFVARAGMLAEVGNPATAWREDSNNRGFSNIRDARNIRAIQKQ